jgi:hypothetical protein
MTGPFRWVEGEVPWFGVGINWTDIGSEGAQLNEAGPPEVGALTKTHNMVADCGSVGLRCRIISLLGVRSPRPNRFFRQASIADLRRVSQRHRPSETVH